MSTHIFTDLELLYAATARCVCGAGLAYPLRIELLPHHEVAMKMRAWRCSNVLKCNVDSEGHSELSFAFYKVREETSINNQSGETTRPPGTIAYTVGYAKCPKCGCEWHSGPYSACGLSHHWLSGSCPQCGYDVGSDGIWSSEQGIPIEVRYKDVVLSVQPEE